MVCLLMVLLAVGCVQVLSINGTSSPTVSTVSDISMNGKGTAYMCVMNQAGMLKCFGRNDHGQLGIGTHRYMGDHANEMGDYLPYVDLGSGQYAKSLSVGETHSCVVLISGNIKCWGDGQYGALGYGNIDDIGDNMNEMGDMLPYVPLSAKAKFVECGSHITCAHMVNDQVRCWGRGRLGALGQENDKNLGDNVGEIGRMKDINLGKSRHIKSLSVGNHHACALLDNHKVVCWGYGGNGQLGIGNNKNIGDDGDEMGPNLVYFKAGMNYTALAVTCGHSITCVVRSDWSLVCLGKNWFGALGAEKPNRNLGRYPDEVGKYISVTRLGPFRKPLMIHSGSNFQCALLDNGSVKCWGLNNKGVLGIPGVRFIGRFPGSMGGSLPEVMVNSPINKVLGNIGGSKYSTCVQRNSTCISCWGRGTNGVLGRGTTESVGLTDMPQILTCLDLGTDFFTMTRNTSAFSTITPTVSTGAVLTVSPSVSPVTVSPLTNVPVTASPVTSSPKTASPVTVSPETLSPVMILKYTTSPVTTSPETASPVTASPETVSPVTVPPVTASPVTASPDTVSPVTVPPVTASPVTASPVTASPVTASPVTASPMTVSPILMTPVPVTFSPTTVTFSPFSSTPTDVSIAPVSVSPTVSPVTVSPSSISPISYFPLTASPETLSPTVTTVAPATITPTVSAHSVGPPVLNHARFFPDFSGIEAIFSQYTSAPKSANCSRLVTSTTFYQLGANPSCVWKSNGLILNVLFGQGWNITQLGIRGDIIGSAVSPDNKMKSVTLKLELPKTSKVTVRLVGPQIVGICDTVKLTTTSSGSAGKNLTFSWKYVSSQGGRKDEEINKKINSLTGQTLIFPASMLPIGTHTFESRATNWLGRTSASSWELRRSDSIPRIETPLGTEFLINPEEDVRLEVKIQVSECSNVKQSNTPGVARWTQQFPMSAYLSSPTARALSPKLSTQVIRIRKPNLMSLYFPKNTFTTGSIYAFNCLAKGTASSRGFNTTFIVKVLEPGVIARINGGTRRLITVIPGVTKEVVFGSSGSRDLAYPGTPIRKFVWGLFRVSVDRFGNEILNSIVLPKGVNGSSRISVSTVLFEAYPDALFKMVLKVIGRNSRISSTQRWDETTQLIETTKSFVRDVKMSIVSERLSSVKVLNEKGIMVTGYEVDVTSTVTISVTTNNVTTSRYKLKKVPSHTTLSYSSNNNLDLSLQENLDCPPGSEQLVIKAGVMSPHLTYTISVVVTNSLTLIPEGKASIVIVGNGGPVGGTLITDKTSGVSLIDTFLFQCIDWSDSHTPLSYSFHRKDQSKKNVKSSTTLCQQSGSNLCQAVLPLAENGSPALVIFAYVMDAMGAKSESNYVRVITTISHHVNLNDTGTLIQDKVKSGDIAGVVSLASSTISYLTSNDPATNTTTEQNHLLRKGLIESARSLTRSNDGSEYASIVAPINLIQAATQFSNPKDIPKETIDSTLDIVEEISGISDELPLEAISSSVSSIGNLVAASVQTGSSSASNITSRSEAIMLSLSSSVVSSKAEGQNPTEVVTDYVTLVSQKQSPGKSLDLNSTSGLAKVFMPDNLPMDPTQSVIGSFSVFVPGFHPSGEPSSRALSINVMQSGKLLEIQNLSTPVQFTIQTDGFNYSAGSNKKKTYFCRFWDTAALNWSTNGVQTLKPPSNSSMTTACSSTHLSVFDVAEFTEFQFEINSFSDDDIVGEAFLIGNAYMVFCFIMVVIWIIMLYLAFKWDMYIEKSRGERISADFWQKFNRMRQIRLSKRSWRHMKKILKWGFQRRHPWLSIFLRHRGDFMTTAKRVNVLMILLFSMMTTTALFMGTTQKYGPLPRNMSAGLLSAVATGPVPFLMG
ncbi:hypothetical protein AAMO2058_001346300 [Amorphochlora amoebiformis]